VRVPRLAAIDRAIARRWKPFDRGDRDQWLVCEGSAFARFVACMHYRWPWTRGQWRLLSTLGRIPVARRQLSAVAFRSRRGVPLRLDMTSDHFLHISGRLSPEPFEIAVMARVVREGDLFVDVGAHWGLYVPHVLPSLGPSGNYLAIEPSAGNCALLRRTFAQAERFRLVQAAIGERSGSAKLLRSGSSEAYIGEAEDGEAVEVMRLDALLSDADAQRPVVIKVDTEGMESAVVRGCSALRERGIRPVFLLEFLPALHGQSRENVVEAIHATFGADYGLWGLEPREAALIPLPPGASVPSTVRNILAVPPELRSRLEATGLPSAG